MAARFQTHLLEPLHLPDVQGGMFWPWAFAHALWSGEPLYLRPELQWPVGQDLRLIIWNHGVQLLLFPLFLLFSPVAATNLSALWLNTLNGAAGAWAGGAASRSRWGALAGLAVAACAPYGVVEAGVGRPEQGLWAPLALFFGGLVRLWDDPGDRRAALVCGVGVGLAGAIYWFYAIFLVTLVAVVFPVAAAAGALTRARLAALVLAGGVSVVVALPFAAPLLAELSAAPAVIDAAVAASAPVEEMQQRASVLFPWGHLGPWAVGEERAWRAPLLALPLCLLSALFGRGGVRIAGVMGTLAALLAAGPVLLGPEGAVSVAGYRLAMPQALLNVLPGYGRFWWPYRWQGVMLGAAVVAVPAAVARLPRPAVWAVAVGLWSAGEGAWMLRDGGVRPVVGPAVVPELFVSIGQLEGGPRPILQLPSAWLRNSRVGWIAWHHQPIDGGMGWGLLTAQADARRAALSEVPLVAALEAAEAGRVLRRASWSAEEAGGFHYVVLYATEGPGADRGRRQRVVSGVLGEPFYDDGAVVAWVVPGVGSLPPPQVR